jgi:MoaA/NifB/PqqE/SkfB family radical SAM enzyme
MKRTTSIERNTGLPGRGAAPARSLDRSISGFFHDTVRLSLGHPARARFFAKTALHQRRAAARRKDWEARGVRVPPLMIVSVTRQCNLRCAGCFVQAQAAKTGSTAGPLTEGDLRRMFGEARDLGVSVVALAGGEPLTRPEILDVAGEHPEILFVLVTNGSLVDGPILDRLERRRNIIPVISLEGFEKETDDRRGGGAYRHALRAMEQMESRGMFFGTSIMVTRANFALTTSRVFVRSLVERGSRLFFYVDYVPIQPGTDHLVPSATQRGSEALTMDLFREEFPGIFLAASASEQAFGECLAAGKAFIHVSPEGALEPCPFAPYSDVNVRDTALVEALRSDLMRKIRDSEEHLSESDGGCALWNKRAWVESLGSAEDGRRTPEPSERRAA